MTQYNSFPSRTKTKAIVPVSALSTFNASSFYAVTAAASANFKRNRYNFTKIARRPKLATSSPTKQSHKFAATLWI